MQKIKNQKGQSLIEYLLLTALVAISVTGVVRIMGHSISAKFTDITDVIQGHDNKRSEVERVEERHYRKKDMSDFMQGAINRKK